MRYSYKEKCTLGLRGDRLNSLGLSSEFTALLILLPLHSSIHYTYSLQSLRQHLHTSSLSCFSVFSVPPSPLDASCQPLLYYCHCSMSPTLYLNCPLPLSRSTSWHAPSLRYSFIPSALSFRSAGNCTVSLQIAATEIQNGSSKRLWGKSITAIKANKGSRRHTVVHPRSHTHTRTQKQLH